MAVGKLKVWDVPPAGTVTLVEGKAEFDPDSVTVAPPLGAALLNVTVTPTLFPPTTEVAETLTETTVTGTRLTVTLRDELPSVAVIVAVCAEGIEPAVTVKLADVALAATVAEAGTPSRALLSDNVTLVAAVGAGLIETVQVVDAPEVRLAELHDRDVRLGTTAALVIVPPVEVSAITLPDGEAPELPVTPMEAEAALAASVTLTTATTPLGMIALFMPDARHI